MRAPLRSAAFALCLAGFAATAHAAAPQSELDATLKQLEQSRNDRVELKKKRDSIEGELKNLQSDSIVLAAQMQRMETQLASREKSFSTLKQQLDDKQAAMANRQEDTAALLHAIIRMQRMPRAMVVAQPGDTQELLQTASALSIAYGGVEHKMAELQVELNELATLQQAIEVARSDLRKEESELRKKQTALNNTLNERGRLLRSVNTDYDKLEARIATLSRSSQSLTELIKNIEKEKTLFEQIGTPQSKPQAPTKTASAPAPSGSFAGMKGRLPYPAAGNILHRYGDRKGKVDRYQGHVLQTAAGANITAPHSGKVVFTGKFMDYGNMAIIEHGNGYHSLIAGLSVVRASLGQSVVAGEPIGSMGNSAQARELYVELRKDSKAIDPSSWMGNLSNAIATR